jgi:hypothetical protein
MVFIAPVYGTALPSSPPIKGEGKFPISFQRVVNVEKWE